MHVDRSFFFFTCKIQPDSADLRPNVHLSASSFPTVTKSRRSTSPNDQRSYQIDSQDLIIIDLQRPNNARRQSDSCLNPIRQLELFSPSRLLVNDKDLLNSEYLPHLPIIQPHSIQRPNSPLPSGRVYPLSRLVKCTIMSNKNPREGNFVLVSSDRPLSSILGLGKKGGQSGSLTLFLLSRVFGFSNLRLPFCFPLFYSFGLLPFSRECSRMWRRSSPELGGRRTKHAGRTCHRKHVEDG